MCVALSPKRKKYNFMYTQNSSYKFRRKEKRKQISGHSRPISKVTEKRLLLGTRR